MISRREGRNRNFLQNNEAYIPFAIIGIFIVLASIMVSFYLTKMDYEVAEAIYDNRQDGMEKTAADLASADLARCLNYAGMQALKWQGEHPIIRLEDAAYDEWGKDGFSVSIDTRDVEPGEVLDVSVTLPSNVFQAIVSLFTEKPRTLVVQGSSGTIYQTIVYDELHSFWSLSEFQESILVPENAADDRAYLILSYGNETKATNWFHVATNPVKDITAHHFNTFIEASYQDDMHTFNNYAINVEQNISSSRIRIDKINGTLERELERSENEGPDYTIYYTMSIDNLNYSLVDISTGEMYNDSMDISTVITSREPLLEELTNEYERSLNDGMTSDIVLGATNIRTFTYGPWQHYLNGPLNIVTSPSLTSSVNAGTIYAQKRIFDSVDPWALTYTTYYNGKVLYNDIKRDSSDYEEAKEKNLSSTYDSLSSDGSFNVSISAGINGSMKDCNTSLEEVANNSKITISVSNFTDAVYYGWVFNDNNGNSWDARYPDMLHDVSHEVYSATIQGQVFRDGFDKVNPYGLDPGISSFDSVSYDGRRSKTGKDITWKGHYPISISHNGALVPEYDWNGVIDLDHKVNVDASSHKWYFKDVRVEPVSNDIVCEGVGVSYDYLGNDTLVSHERTDGYLNSENHSFDWRVTYKIKFKVRTRWNIYYDYHWSYKTYSSVSGWNFHSGDSSKSLKNYPLQNVVSVFHEETESEDITIVYHQYLPSGGYDGFSSNYEAGTSHDYRNTPIVVDGVYALDQCSSDAADKYRDMYVNVAGIEANHILYSNGSYVPKKKVYCDIPGWLHKTMAMEMEEMFDAINADNPYRDVSLLGDNLGKDPTKLIQAASVDLAAEMGGNSKRESFVQQDPHMNISQFNTSSDACRAIARNEAYDYLLHEMVERNKGVSNSFEDYVEKSFLKETGSSLVKLVGDSVSTNMIFDNPAMDKASTALASEMGIIETMTITCEPHSKYNWTEDITLIVDQYPDYLYHDPDFDMQGQYQWIDEATGREVYPLGVRNVCVFSTGIGDDIAKILEDCADPLKDSISQSMSQSISDMNSEVDSLVNDIASQSTGLIANGTSPDMSIIEDNRSRMMSEYGTSIRQNVPAMVAKEVSSDPVMRDWITESEVKHLTSSYLNSLTDEELIDMVADNTLQKKILKRVSKKIISENPTANCDEMDAVLYRLEADLRIGVADGVCDAIKLCQVSIDQCFLNINTELQNKLDESTEKLTGQLAEKMEQRLQKSMNLVPCGLPVIPPNWVCTVNVWEYDVVGKYRTFEVTDNDNECMFNPYFGHDAQVYVREKDTIYHPTKVNEMGYVSILGDNMPISFKFNGYAATVVGPGSKGVGDKIGGRDEESVGYDELLNEIGVLYE
ncbi:hypothetical protein V7O66_07230 [Methanolobus sp. ZRKC3]|uniref:DUF7286 family protein n=1 Tax=Methanolobus sp. ZRKC3 TaxID=3125786 RepID=UPI00325698A6